MYICIYNFKFTIINCFYVKSVAIYLKKNYFNICECIFYGFE